MFTLLVPALFSIASWEETPVETDPEGFFQLRTVRSEQTFGGVPHHVDLGMVGKATSSLVWSHPSDLSPSTFTGQTIFSGSVHRRSGSLTLLTHGTYKTTHQGGLLNWTWEVRGSAGELKGVSGDGGFEILIPSSSSTSTASDPSSYEANGVRWVDLDDEQKRLGGKGVEAGLELRFPGSDGR